MIGLKVNLQELASMHKQTSTGMITDFEKAIATISGEKKVILKKVSFLVGSESFGCCCS